MNAAAIADGRLERLREFVDRFELVPSITPDDQVDLVLELLARAAAARSTQEVAAA